MWIILKVLVFWPQGMWDLPNQKSNPCPCIGRESRNHWTAREVPGNIFWEGSEGYRTGQREGLGMMGGQDGVLIMASVNPLESLWSWDCSPELSWVGVRALAFTHLQWQVPGCGKGAWPWGGQMSSVSVQSLERSHEYSDFPLLEVW